MDPRTEKLKMRLAPLVEQYIHDGIGDWTEAANAAVSTAIVPKEEESPIYWFILLAGNLTWAGMAFMPAEAVLPKVIGMIGAGFGSDTVHEVKKMLDKTPNPDNAKLFLQDIIAKRGDTTEDSLVEDKSEGFLTELVNHLVAQAGMEWRKHHSRQYPDDRYVNSTVAAQRLDWIFQWLDNLRPEEYNQIRYYTYSEFIFPDLIERGDGQVDARLGQVRQSLTQLMRDKVNSALADFRTQWDVWQRRKYKYMMGELGYVPHRHPRDPPEVVIPFEPTIRFAGVKLDFRAGAKTPGQLAREWLYGDAAA